MRLFVTRPPTLKPANSSAPSAVDLLALDWRRVWRCGGCGALCELESDYYVGLHDLDIRCTRTDHERCLLRSSSIPRMINIGVRFGLIDALPRELQMHVLSFLDDWHDVGALLLALPPLGIDVLRTYPADYAKEPLLSVALALHSKAVVLSEALMRRYVCDHRASAAGCEWLSRAAAACGSELCVRFQMEGRVGIYRVGEKAAERKVRAEHPEGQNQRGVRTQQQQKFFEGEHEDERIVRIEMKSGEVQFFEGEKGEERMVRAHLPDDHKSGCHNVFYEGGKGAERIIRAEWPSGIKRFYEGEKGEARLIRAEWPSGTKKFYEGEKGEERMVRFEWPWCKPSTGVVQAEWPW